MAEISVDRFANKITSSSFIKDPETLISKDGNFTFGFFSPTNSSTNRYVGIWWKSQLTNIWVANRKHPLNDSNGIVTISDDGNLVVLNGQKQVIWSSNVSNIESNNTSVHGYMSPEYAMHGHFSEKSDVFSFGVLLLEIIIGRRNSSFYGNEHALSLLGFVWIQWREDNILSLIDPEIYDHNDHKNILICIHIGLLCVQESAVDRPTMATVISMLNSEVASLPPPTEPAFILRQNMSNSKSTEENQSVCSINNVSITDVCGR
ncbi:G-type lectin S-receptor-like serine/threonine-protein kinase At1g11330 [Trifolium pratense]|uniref:G-type lectin S-receptor-like serine/threonine-protein kinase At1g11330 n=1 Tax=Trifolium pratense TaxID=57577 RepID=UPI001E694CCC|nr:G-type lectin S-receptor-like serine/threonine-protein kinase At1g11330 [Trifolium pratense]